MFPTKPYPSGLRYFLIIPIPPGKLWIVFPPGIVLSKTDWVYGIDGKFLHRDAVILIHRDVTHGENLYWSFWRSESYLAFDSDLKVLSRLINNSNGNFLKEQSLIGKERL